MLTLHAVPGLPMVRPGDDLAQLTCEGIDRLGVTPARCDVFVMAQKIVSKAQNRYRCLADVTPSDRALALAAQVDKDPRLVEIILSESCEVVGHRPGVLVTRHRLGFVMANAGIDRSNLDTDDEDVVLLLPDDPDQACADLRNRLCEHYGADIAVIICDSVGRPWRLGTVVTALGAAGLPALQDLRGSPDLQGRPLAVSEVGYADQIAAAAGLLMGEANEGCPLVLVRGLHWREPAVNVASTLRSADKDIFSGSPPQSN